MFGGLVETLGVVLEEKMDQACKYLTIQPQLAFDDVKMGDSIAVNGVCLTVTQIKNNQFDFCLVPETLSRSNLGQLLKSSVVNLERSMKLSDRIGGHCVQGHVDAVGEIIDIQEQGSARLMSVKMPSHLGKYIINKGYIGLDGMSITVVEAKPDYFTVIFIPHTQEVTIVNRYRVGTLVNIEVDILGKYIEKIMRGVNT